MITVEKLEKRSYFLLLEDDKTNIKLQKKINTAFCNKQVTEV